MTNDWAALSEAGYWVFPVRGRKKFPTSLRGKKWDQFLVENDRELLHAHLIHGGGDTTGAAICPQEGDPTPLLILDVDTYGLEFDELWGSMCPGEEVPDNLLVVRSSSGGHHIWWALPKEINRERLPATFDFGEGVKGEVRASTKARRLLMLPGSLAMNKHGKPARYTIVQGTLDPSTLPFPPTSLLARLVGRVDQGKADETAQTPTELAHLIEGILPHLKGAVPEGGRNSFSAQLGQVAGRLHPAARPTSDLVSQVYKQVAPSLGAGFPEKEFRVAFVSGWATGSKNASKYQAKEKHPTVSDVRAECESIFGASPWLVEVRDSSGKIKDYLVGFGGSAKRRHEATRTTSIRDLREILPTLTRLSSASMDVVARSPMFIQAGWAKVLEYMLLSEKGVDQLGIAPEERFNELLDDWARVAATDLMFLEAWTGKRPPGAASPFIVWPLDGTQTPALVIPPILQEALITQLGDIPKAKRLVAKQLLTKTLVGMRSGQKVWVCPLASLRADTQEYIGSQYEVFVREASDEVMQ